MSSNRRLRGRDEVGQLEEAAADGRRHAHNLRQPAVSVGDLVYCSFHTRSTTSTASCAKRIAKDAESCRGAAARLPDTAAS